MKRRLSCLLLLWHLSAWAQQDLVIQEERLGSSASLRAATGGPRSCPISEAQYQQVVRDWLHRTQGGDNTKPVTGMALGRAQCFPWLSAYLSAAAAHNRHWNARSGRARPGKFNDNSLVAAILFEPAMAARLQAPFAGSPYVVTGVSVEKVLVANYYGGPQLPEYPGQRLPFDAQVWLKLGHTGQP